MTVLRGELTNDPAGLGYDLADLAAVEALINACSRTRVVSHFTSERGLLERFGADPLAADTLLSKLENFTLVGHPLSSIVKRALKFMAQPEGIDIGALAVRQMLGALVQYGVITQTENDGLTAMATEPCSRAGQLGLPYVTDTMLREAVA